MSLDDTSDLIPDSALSASDDQPQASDPTDDIIPQSALEDYKPGKAASKYPDTSATAESAPVQAIHSMVSGAASNIGATGHLISDWAGGKVHSFADASRSTQEYLKAHPAYQPTTEGGRKISDLLASPVAPLNWPGMIGRGVGKGVADIADRLHAPSQVTTVLEPAGEALGNIAPAVAGGVAALRDPGGGFTFKPFGDKAPSGAAGEAAAASVDHPESIGAARASVDVSKASPELQSTIQAAQDKGTPIHQDAVVRHVQADTLPIPVRLTKGQATQDPVQLSNELNSRARTPALAQRFNEQNGQLAGNVQAIRDQVGPEVFSTNPVEHGDTLIAAYQAKDAPVVADIKAKYQALEDANGGQFPVDAKALLGNASQALHKQLLFDNAPKPVMAALSRLAESGGMTFENFESLRTNLARTMRSSADANERAAAGVIRDAMEQLPLAPGAAANLKPLADAARAAARARFEALRADPAYDAAVGGDVPPDRFVQKFVIGAPRDQVGIMRQNLADNPSAVQTMGVAAVDHLRTGAGVDAFGNGNFSQAGFNKNLSQLLPKIRFLLNPEHAEALQNLGDVARYTQIRPRGSFVNESNTFTALKSHAAGAAEGAVNMKTGGIGGTLIKNLWGNKKASAEANAALEPGAGIRK